MTSKEFPCFLSFIIYIIFVGLKKALCFIPLQKVFYQLLLDGSEGIETAEYKFFFCFLSKILNFIFS